MIEAREDVERLFLVERLPPEAMPIYDTEGQGTHRVVPIRLEEPWDTKEFLLDELRCDVVRSILEVKSWADPIDPFTLANAHEAMANRDVRLDAFLVHPEFVPLCVNMTKPFFGYTAKLFEHPDVPYAEIYGLCEPEYLGRVPVQKGRPGAFRFSSNVIWGNFKPRAGV